MSCFNYSVIFSLPKEQEAACFGSLFRSFSARGWFARKPGTLHVEKFLNFSDKVGYACLEADKVGPEVGVML